MFVSEGLFTDSNDGDEADPTRSLSSRKGIHQPSSALTSGLAAERQVYTGGSGAAASRPGTASMPVRPVSARTWGNTEPSPSGAPATGMNVYHNDLFGAEEEEVVSVEQAPKDPQLAARQRMEQQKALAAQKRKERSMMSGAVMRNDRPTSSRPGSARPGGRPPSAMGRPTSGIGRFNDPGGANRLEPGGVGSSSFNMQGMQRSVSLAESEAGAASVGATEVATQLKAQGLSTEYDPAASGGGADSPSPSQQGGARSATRPNVSASVDTSDMRVFLMQPGPKNGPVLCHIRRSKGSAKLYPKYVLYLGDSTNGGDDEKFLLSARKRKKSKSSNYLISLDEEDQSRQSGNFFGKLRSNFVGTEFTIYDKGAKPGDEESGSSAAQSAARSELGAVVYQYNVLGTRGPRKMTAIIPKVDEAGQRALFQPKDEKDGILERYKADDNSANMTVMQNKPPKWNEQMQAYCLNFHGRVTHASVKNFQLVSDDNKEHIILQFGKVGKDTFTMDYQWPISALQAFAICLTSFDNKLACE